MLRTSSFESASELFEPIYAFANLSDTYLFHLLILATFIGPGKRPPPSQNPGRQPLLPEYGRGKAWRGARVHNVTNTGVRAAGLDNRVQFDEPLRVDQEQRAHIRLLLDHELALAKRAIGQRIASIYTEHAAVGRLKSGATVRVAVRAMEEMASQLVSVSVQQVSAVAQDTDAFAELMAALGDYLDHLSTEVAKVANMAAGRPADDLTEDSVSAGAKALFVETRSHVVRKLEIHRFSFTKPSSGPSNIKLANPPTEPKNTGGRPLAKHWDDMWAAIALALYNGDLDPKTQADIERAMLSWLTQHNLDHSEAAVRGRARRLWDLLSRSRD